MSGMWRLHYVEDNLIMLTLNKDSLNQRIPDARTDKGWEIRVNLRHYMIWERKMTLDPGTNVESVIKYMKNNNDYPGYNGIQLDNKATKGDYTVFTSTYDPSKL